MFGRWNEDAAERFYDWKSLQKTCNDENQDIPNYKWNAWYKMNQRMTSHYIMKKVEKPLNKAAHLKI